MKLNKIVLGILLMHTFLMAEMQSSYTKIDDAHCKTIHSETEGYSSDARCESYANIAVHLSYMDGREDLLLTRNNRTYDLDFRDKVWSGFSEFGKTIEWRFPKENPTEPVAMISRYICGSYDEDGRNIHFHRLVVTKITDKEMCIVGWIAPGKEQNIKARKMADRALKMPCAKNYDRERT